MEKSEENIKAAHSRGLIKLNEKKQNVCYDYKKSQRLNKSPVSFYEEDFPSLSEIGIKSNLGDKTTLSHENSLSYSARLKTLPKKELFKNVKFYTGRNCNLPSSHTSDSMNSSSKKKKYTSEANQFSKSDQSIDTPMIKSIESSEQSLNFSFSDLKSNNIQNPLPSLNCSKASEVETEDDGVWTVVKGKSLSDRNVLKDSGQVKHKRIKTNKNIPNMQSSLGFNNSHHQKNNNQNVDIDRTKKCRNMRENFTELNKCINTEKRTEFSMTKDAHSQSSTKTNFFMKKVQDQTKQEFANSRSNQIYKQCNSPHYSSESKNKVYKNHYVESSSLKDVKSSSNFMQSCVAGAGISEFSDRENVSYEMSQRNFNQKLFIRKEHSDVKFDSSIKTYQKSYLKPNSDYFQAAKNAHPQSRASGNSSTNKVMQQKNHELRNKDGVNKKIHIISDTAQNHHFTVSNNQNNTLNQGNQINKTQAASSLVPSRKKRKSKIKRQAAMQSDKIRLITPETFSKILNQKNNENAQSHNTISVNIDDCDEYPELGAAMTPKYSLEGNIKSIRTDLRRENPILSETKDDIKCDTDQTKDELSHEHSCHPSDIVIEVDELNQPECDPEEEEKVPVHCNDPITISIFDMLQANKKRKDSEKSSDAVKVSPSKVNSKKLITSGNYHFVNPLGSSKPAVKRGKEREKPKPKKLSQLKKIILMDRKKRKESIRLASKENPSVAENDDSSKDSGLFLNFNKSVIDEINLELLNQTNDLLEKSIVNLKIAASEVKDYMLDSGNTDSKLSKEINNFPFTIVANDMEDINIEPFQASNSFVQIDFSTLKPNADLETVDCGVLTVSNNCTSVDNENNTTSSLEHFFTTGLATDPLGDPHLVEKCKHLMSKYCEESCHPSIKINYSQFIDKQSIENDNILADIRLLFSRRNKSIFNERCKLRRYHYDHVLADIRYLFKYPNSEEILSEYEDKSALIDIRYLFESENCKLFHGENISDIASFTHSENIVGNIKNDTCPRKEDFTINFKNGEKITDLNEDICSTDIILSKDQDPIIHRKYSEKEIFEACGVLLHSKKFRSYCNHFLSKELEEAVYVLLDDLARFQDRMHQKDPVKARMKRRLLYGMREIKRHMKLKKLKCIIIASDIEDSKTEGGLNDILNDLKSLAKDYQIPCVFSHLRKRLGYICHKSAPVSAVGIFNYEGAEVHFKKMMELQNECKLDYDEVIKSLSLKLSDEQIDLIFRTIQKDMSDLHNVITAIFKEYFPKPADISVEKDTANKSTKSTPSIKGTEFHNHNENTSTADKTVSTNKEISPAIPEKNNLTVEDLKNIEEASKICTILEKYRFINY